MGTGTKAWAQLQRGLAVALTSAALAGAFVAPARAAEVRVFSVVGWLNQLVSQSQLAVLGRVQADANGGQRGEVAADLEVGQVYHGPRLGRRMRLTMQPTQVEGRFLFPQPLRKDQWVLAFCRSSAGRWATPPWGRIVETPYEGLTFYTGPEVVLSDAAPGMSWTYVLEALEQIVATRRRVINAYLPTLRVATTQEQRDRTRWAIEWQVKESLGLPVP